MKNDVNSMRSVELTNILFYSAIEMCHMQSQLSWLSWFTYLHCVMSADFFRVRPAWYGGFNTRLTLYYINTLLAKKKSNFLACGDKVLPGGGNIE